MSDARLDSMLRHITRPGSGFGEDEVVSVVITPEPKLEASRVTAAVRRVTSNPTPYDGGLRAEVRVGDIAELAKTHGVSAIRMLRQHRAM